MNGITLMMFVAPEVFELPGLFLFVGLRDGISSDRLFSLSVDN